MASKSTPKKAISMHTQLATSVLNIIEPLFSILDRDFPAEMGHEPPSRQDKGIQILISNLCRDCHQQIYGVEKTAKYAGFPGIKDTLDRVEDQITRHYAIAERNGDVDSIASDPNTHRLVSYLESTTARYEAVNEMYTAFRDAYRELFGTDWVYASPGLKTSPVAKEDALAAVRAIMEKRKAAAPLAS